MYYSFRFAPSLQVISYVGDKEKREDLRASFKEKSRRSRVVLSTYEVVLEQKALF